MTLLIDHLISGLRKTNPRLYDALNRIVNTLLTTETEPIEMSQAALTRFSTTLGIADSSLRVIISDYNHVLQWDGSTWSFAPGTEVSNWYAFFDPSGPLPSVGWVKADGSIVNVLKSDGTLTAVTTQIIADSYYRI